MIFELFLELLCLLACLLVGGIIIVAFVFISSVVCIMVRNMIDVVRNKKEK